MKLTHIFLLFLSLFFISCSVKPLAPVEFKKQKEEISYLNEIKPILDKRCVSCHSCYNSPCQLKLSSNEGLKRGASKKDVYANRLTADEPTRLFIDAHSTNQWRQKGFFSVTDKLKNKNESIMMQYLYQKKLNPQILGSYNPEEDELSCVKNSKELNEYFQDNPHKGMPYGFPSLAQRDYKLLMNWLDKGAKVKKKKEIIPAKEQILITRFEKFFNQKDIKHKVTARYIYEHLFLAHISFDKNSKNFYELVRSKTKIGKVQTIATRFPYDKIDEPFYYRFKKITSTIVHKTHMVYNMDNNKLQRYKELFIDIKWESKPYLASYDKALAPNALKVFEQIPANSRYQFLLDDIHYIIMNFIRGPVCKGQIALNVIQDHFWVMFLDPKYDLSIQDKLFLSYNYNNLSIPNQYGDDPNIFKTFSILKNYKLSKSYHVSRSNFYRSYYNDGLPLDSLWKSKKGDSILTIYRHFDSASVHKGALGDIPKTLWVIDFPLLERIYYSLVAGFDIFGNTAHQLMVRKNMDRLRIEGESNFLDYLPQVSRKRYFSHWYQGWIASQLTIYHESHVKANMKFKTAIHKREFVLKALDYLQIKKDPINFISLDYKDSSILKEYKSKKDIEKTLKLLSQKNHVNIIKHFTNSQANLAFLRVKMESQKDLVYSLVINRWHDNVALLFNEESRLNHDKDTIDFIEGFVGSYPNIFLEVEQKDLPKFFHLIKEFKNTPKEQLAFREFTINRANEKFWQKYDWFDKRFKKQDPLQYGIFDLNRYFSEAYK